jgi:MFS family permease
VGILSSYKAIVGTRERKEVLAAMTGGQLLVQLSSMPVTLALPSMARHFDASIEDAAWIVIINLLVLGSTVFLGARLGDRYGHPKVFFLGTIIITAAAVLIASAQSLEQVIIWRGVQGLGAGLIHGNGNAMLAYAFPSEERGRAYAFPITGSRLGTLIGLGLFGLFLEFLSWRLVFLTLLPIGLIVIWSSIPVLRQAHASRSADSNPIDYLGAGLLVATASVFLLSGMHVHGGEESFTSESALSYHIPMHLLSWSLLALFIVVERRAKHPFLDFRHFRDKYFTLSLISNVMFHLSMLATFILVPVMIEEGKGLSPIFVTLVLLPHQSFGLFMPLIAGNVYDRYNPKFLRPGCMLSIAAGFVLLGLFSGQVSVWLIPLLLLPISVGTNAFNTVNNATVMNALPVEHRGFASGMLETTRDLGHAFGATLATIIMATVLPSTIALMTGSESQGFYIRGFQVAALAVVAIMLAGAVINSFHKALPGARASLGSAQAGAATADN